MRALLLGAVARLAVANLTAAVAVFTYATFVAPDLGGPEESAGSEITKFVLFMALILPVGGVVAAKRLREIAAWLATDAEATDDMRRGVLGLPSHLAGIGLLGWLAAVFVFGVVDIPLGNPVREEVTDMAATVLGAFVAALMSYLLIERQIRPILARALGGRPPGEARAIGIRPRLLLSWALGSGVPLLAIAAAQLRFGPYATDPSPTAIVFLALIGVGSGAVLVGLAAKSVAEPLGELRGALAEVRRGATDVAVTVDEGGEVGQLQGGFNDMVEGLRERRRLEDLFGRYVGADVAEAALERGVALGGEQRPATALFVDLVGSTSMAEQCEPSEVVALLNEFFGRVVRVVEAEGGWINKFEGDGALCVFGAPADQPDHAARALRAARRLATSLADIDLEAGIGVSSGLVVAGTVGAEARFEYTVIGDPVNEAARLTESAKTFDGRVLASEAAVEAAGDEAERWEPAAELQLRGRTAPTKAYVPGP